MKEIKYKEKIKRCKLSLIFLLLVIFGILCGRYFIKENSFDCSILSIFSYRVFSGDFISCLNYSLLPVCVYLIFGFFCSVSVFGFILLPCECCFIGLSLFYSCYEAWLIIGNKIFWVYLPFWAAYTAFLIEYIKNCFKVSLRLFTGFVNNKKTEELKIIFRENIKKFYSAMLVSLIFTFFLVFIGFGVNLKI